jgi:hypothetical protein
VASKSRRSPATAGRKTNLDAALDTGGTISPPSRGSEQFMGNHLEVETVDPALKPEPKSWHFILQDVPPGLKTAIAVILSVVSGVGYGVWYLSKLDSNVDTLKISVGEVKVRTEELVRTSIQHDEKLGTLEKAVESLNAKDVSPTKKK